MPIQKSSRHSLAKTFFDRRPTSQIAVEDSVTLKIYSKSSNNHKLLHGYRWKLELCYFVGQAKVLDSVEALHWRVGIIDLIRLLLPII